MNIVTLLIIYNRPGRMPVLLERSMQLATEGEARDQQVDAALLALRQHIITLEQEAAVSTAPGAPEKS